MTHVHGGVFVQVHIMQHDLKLGHGRAPWRHAMARAVGGGPDSMRAKCGQVHGSVREQVEALIEMVRFYPTAAYGVRSHSLR